MKFLTLILVQFLSSLSLANVNAVTCEHSKDYKTGSLEFQQDHKVDIYATIKCDKPLPTADMDYNQAEALIEGNSCVTRLTSEGRYEQFSTGFDRTIWTHSIEAGGVDSLTIEPKEKCVKTACKPFLGGCSCVQTAPAPELGFNIKGSGIIMNTNSTEQLNERMFEKQEVSMFSSVRVLNGVETETINGIITYEGTPLRDKYISTDIHEKQSVTNLSYNHRDLYFSERQCQF